MRYLEKEDDILKANVSGFAWPLEEFLEQRIPEIQLFDFSRIGSRDKGSLPKDPGTTNLKKHI